MTSAASHRWTGERAALLEQLFEAHQAVGGVKKGRRWATDELNRALVLRLAAQFQGFAKDLHQESAVAFGRLANADPVVSNTIASGLQSGRQLDRGNAQEDALTKDFGRFGLRLWDEMAVLDRRTPQRRTHLKRLNQARNGLAHEDAKKLDEVLRHGYPITLATVRRWRSALDGLTGTMDVVLAKHLSGLFKANPPW